MSINFKPLDFTPQYLQQVADEANRWRTEITEIMKSALTHAQAGHYGFDHSRDISPQAIKELSTRGFKVHSNKRTVTWQANN